MYSTMHTKMLRGMRKKFIMVLLDSSGMYCDLNFIIDGQNIPTQASKAQKPRSWRHPPNVMLPPVSLEGATKNCSKLSNLEKPVKKTTTKKRIDALEFGTITYIGQNGQRESRRGYSKNNLHVTLYSVC